MNRFYLLFYLLVLALLSSGCSFIGLAIGSNTNSDKISYYEEINRDSQNFKSLDVNEGDPLIIFTNNEDSLVGNFVGYTKIPVDDFSDRFMEAFKNLVYFPKVNDTITVVYHNNRLEYFEFLGFEYGSMRLGNFRGSEYDISLGKPYVLLIDGNQILGQSAYEELSAINGGNLKSVTFKKYLNIMEQFDEPTQWAMIINYDDVRKIIQLDDINQVKIPHWENRVLEGFLIGLGIDALMVFIISQLDYPLIDLSD